MESAINLIKGYKFYTGWLELETETGTMERLRRLLEADVFAEDARNPLVALAQDIMLLYNEPDSIILNAVLPRIDFEAKDPLEIRVVIGLIKRAQMAGCEVSLGGMFLPPGVVIPVEMLV